LSGEAENERAQENSRTLGNAKRELTIAELDAATGSAVDSFVYFEKQTSLADASRGGNDCCRRNRHEGAQMSRLGWRPLSFSDVGWWAP